MLLQHENAQYEVKLKWKTPQDVPVRIHIKGQPSPIAGTIFGEKTHLRKFMIGQLIK